MVHFSLVTFNCFGAPAPNVRRRLLVLAHELNQRADNVVCLQEAQAHAYRKLLTHACIGYPFACYEPFVHAPKGGLLTLATLPIERHEFVLYRSRRIVRPPALMDWMLHKGVLVTRMSLAGLPIVALNTHLSANYSVNWNPDNHYARIEHAQLQQLAEIVRAQPPEALVVAAGDFNFPRGSWLYEEFVAASGMIDPLAGDRRPTVRAPPGISERYALPIDFAFVRAPALAALRIESELRFVEKALVGRRPRFLSMR